MKIRCKLIREGGTLIDIDGTEYHFADNGKGDHVVEVANPEHAKRLLSISEAYVAHGEKAVKTEANIDSGNGGNQDAGNEGNADQTGIESMDKPALLALAAEHRIEVNPATPISALRKKLAKAIPAKAAE